MTTRSAVRSTLGTRTYRTLHDLPTPAVVVEIETVRRNIRRMADYCAKHGLALRPHVKTHKSPHLARRQMEGGAAGLTAAKVGEAERVSAAGDDVLLAYPIIGREAPTALGNLAKDRTVRVSLDSVEAAEAVAKAACDAKRKIGLLVELDVGFGRCGVQTAQAAAN